MADQIQLGSFARRAICFRCGIGALWLFLDGGGRG